MRKLIFNKVVMIAAVTAIAGGVLAGCGAKTEEAIGVEETTITEAIITESTDQQVALSNSPEQGETELAGAPYFEAGVYAVYPENAKNQEKTNFYVFNADSYGYTTDGANYGMGLPFSCTQADGTVKFSFGGADSTEEAFVVKADESGKITGAFGDGVVMVFEKLDGVDPDTFDAENYLSDPKDQVYHDANGWSVRYDATNISLTNENGKVFFVYTGECAGTNMITAYYTVDNKGEAAIEELGNSWGEATVFSQGPFPGAESENGYWAVLPPAEEGSGAYMTAIGRDYMDGALIFELSGHNGNDEEMNMAVSDALAAVIDSLTFETYGE